MASFSWQIGFFEVAFMRLSESHWPRFERVDCYSDFFLSVLVIMESTSLTRLPFFIQIPNFSPTETDGVENCE